jgi:hypothetical protein
MQISNPNWEFVSRAILSALKHVDPREVILTIAPSVVQGKKQYNVDSIHNLLKGYEGKLRFLEGTDDRLQVAKSRLFSYDQATSDWIVNMDDDDIVIGTAAELASIGPRAGMFHTDIIGVYVESHLRNKPGDVILRRSGKITTPDESNKFWGSFWGIRRAAWDEVKDRVDRDRIGYNDWRLAWHIIKAGWQDCHLPYFCQLQRIRDYSKVKAYQIAKKAGGWKAVCADLKERWG